MEEVAPKPIWVVALIGLIGFPAPALLYVYGGTEWSAAGLNILVTWSAVIMGFLGGIRWGLESARPEPRWRNLAASTVSPFAGFVLFAARHYIAADWVLSGFLIAFMLQWLFDHSTPENPVRYPRLTTIVTLVACVSLALALEKALRI